MPKMKTRRCAAKRFPPLAPASSNVADRTCVTSSPRRMPKRKMRLGQGALVDATNVKAVRRMMPYA